MEPGLPLYGFPSVAAAAATAPPGKPVLAYPSTNRMIIFCALKGLVFDAAVVALAVTSVE